MTATDELRRLLDERGVEYDGSFGVTEFHGVDGSVIVARNSKSKDGILYVHAYLTPEQAIDATLGRGECQLKRANWDDGTCTWGCICSACDAHLEHETGIGYNYCPICGAKVVRA